jgi:hypothetical protein
LQLQSAGAFDYVDELLPGVVMAREDGAGAGRDVADSDLRAVDSRQLSTQQIVIQDGTSDSAAITWSALITARAKVRTIANQRFMMGSSSLQVRIKDRAFAPTRVRTMFISSPPVAFRR